LPFKAFKVATSFEGMTTPVRRFLAPKRVVAG
jgi:hypothetical protein